MRRSNSALVGTAHGFVACTLRIGGWGLVAVALATCGEPTATKGPGAGTKLVFTTQPATATAGATISPAVVVTVQDNNGITDAGYTGNVTLTITTGTGTPGATLAGTLAAPVIQGLATFSGLRINRSGAGYSLSATAPGLTLAAPSSAFNINPGPAVKLIFTGQPITTAAGVSIAPAVVVTAQDLNSNTATSFVGPVAISLGTNPVTGTLSGTASLNATAGVASFNSLKINKTGTGYTLKATSLGLTEDVSASFSINPGPATTLVFTGQPSNAVAGAAINPAVVVTAMDGQGNVATGFTAAVALAFATNPGGGALTSASVTATAGLATFPALSINKTGTGYTLSASSGSLNTAAPSAAFNVTPGTANKLAFTVQSSNVVAGAVMAPALVVEVQDGNGNRVTASTASVTVAIGPNPPGASSLGGTAVLNAVAGVATYSTLTLNKTGVGYTLTAAATGLTGATSAGFNVTPGADAKLVFAAALPVNVTAGVVIAPVTVRVLDANDNLTASTATVTMAIGTNNGGGTLSGTTSVNASNGLATFTTLKINKVGAGYTLATASTVPATLTGATSTSFNIIPAAATKLVFTTQPVNATAGPPAVIPTVGVSAQDALGNVDTSFSSNITVAIGANPGGGALGGTLITAAVHGVATYSNLKINKSGIGYQLQATSGSLSPGASSAFNIVAGSAANLAFTVEPITTQAGGSITPIVKVSAQDVLGNTDLTYTGSVTVALGAHAGSPVLSGATAVNAVAGVASFTDLNINLVGTGYTLDAGASGLAGTTSATFNIIPNTVTTVEFTTQPVGPITAGVAMPVVVVTAFDASHNVATQFTGGVSLALTPATGTANAHLSHASSVTVIAVAGVATFSTLSVDSAGTNYRLDVSGPATATSGQFSIVPAPASALAFTTQPGNRVAGVNNSLVVTARDSLGNRATSFTSLVTLTITSGPAGGTILSGGTATASAGVASFTALRNDKVGDYTLSASDGSVNTAVGSASYSITPATAAALFFTGQPHNAVAGISNGPAILVEARDPFDNVATGFTSLVTLAFGANPGSGTLGGTTASASAGIATFSAVTIDKVGTGYSLTASATVPAISGGPSSAFNITPDGATKLVFSTNPVTTTAGVTMADVVVTAQDANNNTATSFTGTVTLGFANNPGGGGLGGTLILPAVAGVVTYDNLSITVAATLYKLQAISGALTQGQSTNFNINAAAATQLVFTGLPVTPVTAGQPLRPGGAVVKAQDQFGNTDPNFTGIVTLSRLSGPTTQLQGDTTIAAILGIATFADANIHVAGIGYTLRAAFTGLQSGNSNLFDVQAAAADHLVFTGNPSNQTAGVAINPAVVVTARDEFDNTDLSFTGATKNVSLTINTGPGSPLVNATATPSAGVATFSTFNVQTVGTRTLRADGGGIQSFPLASGSFDITAAAANHLVFTLQPTDQIAGLPIPVVVTAKDQFGNTDLTFAGPTHDVSLSPVGTPGEVNGATATPVDGVATFGAFNVETAGTRNLAASSDGGTIQSSPLLSNAFTITAATANHLVFTLSPAVGPTVAGQSLTQVQVTARDQFQNPDPAYIGSVTVSIDNNPGLGGPGTLSGTAAQNAVAGVATFTGLSIDKTGTGYTLQATDGSISSSSPSDGFDITNAAATKLGYVQQPNNADAGLTIAPAVTVTAQDQFGNTDPTFSGDATISIGVNPGGGVLSGTLSQAFSSGVATFGDLSIDNPATAYQLLTVSSPVLTQILSATFNIN